MPSLRTVLTGVTTPEDWNNHEDEIARGVAQGIQDDLGQLQRQRQSFDPFGTSFSDKIKAALQTAQPYRVMLCEGDSVNYTSRIVIATSRAAASDAAIKQTNDDNGYAPSEDGGFRLVEVSSRDELRWLLQLMDEEMVADYPPPPRRNALGVAEEPDDDSPPVLRKGNGITIAERLAKLPKSDD